MENLLQLREVLTAAAEGDEDKLKSLSEGDPSILDMMNEEGGSSLMYASANGRESAVRFLLRNHVSIDKENKYEWTALQQACYYGHLAVVGQLLEKGADINKTNVWGSTPLLAATASGNMSLVKMLLTHGAKVDAGRESPTQFTPLMAAAQNGHEGIAAVLLNQKADPNVKLKGSGYTPLMFAALNGQVSLVRLLLKHGADKEMQSATGQKAVNIAWAVGREDIVKVLGYSSRDRPEKFNLSGSAQAHKGAAHSEVNIFTAVRSGDGAVAEIKQLLDRDRSVVNSRNEHGATPLMYASMRNSPQTCRLLIGSGADVNAQDAVSHWTAFMQSVHHGQYAVAKTLLENGADVSIKAKDGSTALEIATCSTSGGNTRMLQLIAEAKRKKLTDNTAALPPEGELQMREEGDTEENFHRWLAVVNDKFEGRRSISNPLAQPTNSLSGSGQGVGDMTTIEEEQLEESAAHKTTPPARLHTRPIPPPFAVTPSNDIIMQRVTEAFMDDSSASPETPTPTPTSHKVFDLDVASSGSTLRQPMMLKPKPNLSSLKQMSVEEDRDHPKQSFSYSTPATPSSGGVPTTPTLEHGSTTPTSGDLPTPPTSRGMPAPPSSRGMPAPPTSRGMPVSSLSRGMPAPPTSRGMPVSPLSRGMPAPPTSRGMPAPPTSRDMPAPPTSRGMPASPLSRGMPAPPTPRGLQMTQDRTGDEASVSQGSRPCDPPLPRPALGRENPFQYGAMPPTAASQSHEPLSANIQSLLQQRSLPGQQHSGPLKADPSYRTTFGQFGQHDRPPIAAGVANAVSQSRSATDRRKKGTWRRRRESFELPTSVPEVLQQLDLHQYLEIMEENEVDMEAFTTMSNEDLLDIGIEDAEHRLQLLNIILKLNRQQSAVDDRLVYQESPTSKTNGFVII